MVESRMLPGESAGEGECPTTLAANACSGLSTDDNSRDT
jgi:hypothetical protein